MKTLYYTSNIKFKPSVAKDRIKGIINALSMATEHTWKKTKVREYSSNEFDILSNLQPRVIYILIKETKEYISEFNFSVYFIENLPNKIISLKNNSLTYTK